MTVDQKLQQEIKDTEVYLSRENEESIYIRDLKKRIELINWVLENMKKPDFKICSLIESRTNNVVLTINQTHNMLEANRLHSELRIRLDILSSLLFLTIKKLYLHSSKWRSPIIKIKSKTNSFLAMGSRRVP